MSMLIRNNPYLLTKVAKKEFLLKRLIRGLYARYLDELYIPEGTTVSYSEDDGRKPPRPNMGCIIVNATSSKRKGNQQVYFFEQFGYKKLYGNTTTKKSS